jgi:glycosyltransferase involved in cell wall biosynthesis/SAM-dependent methyltransferase
MIMQDSISVRPKVAFVVQRSGREVVGGSETLCLKVAEKMRKLWDVEILTTCALDYVTWENYYPEGIDIVSSVPIRRFVVDHPRDVDQFNEYSAYVLSKMKTISIAEGEKWMNLQGPISSGLLDFIKRYQDMYDAFIFFTYLYASTYYGLELVSEKAYLVPTAHEEWPIYLPIWDDWFRKPKGFIFNTLQEKQFLENRFPSVTFNGDVAGIGLDLPEDTSVDRFRKKHALEAPYILYLGRIDPSKGCSELFMFFKRYKAEVAGDLKLVLAGKNVMEIPKYRDIIYLGFIDDQTKFDAISGCEFLVNPSPYESLSIVLIEAWGLNKPTLVTTKSNVLVQQSRRSNAGLWYSDYDEFRECIEYLTKNKSIGAKGREFVENNYSWDLIKGKYLKLLEPLFKKKLDMNKNTSSFYHPLQLAGNESGADILRWLSRYHVEGSPAKEMSDYLDTSFKRFLYTLNLIPEGSGNLLEMGANPYFMSMLLRRYKNDYKLYFSNYFDDTWPATSAQFVVSEESAERIEFPFHHFNIEDSGIPFEPGFFKVILFCEIIEHLIRDPISALLSIKNALEKDGYLILTTPNVSRFENVAKMILGGNIYDAYSAYGHYGRHNREYNQHELHLLLTQLGFEIEAMFSTDIYGDARSDFSDLRKIMRSLNKIKNREHGLGQYIFVRARNVRHPDTIKKPRWLFRSYPPEDLF